MVMACPDVEASGIRGGVNNASVVLQDAGPDVHGLPQVPPPPVFGPHHPGGPIGDVADAVRAARDAGSGLWVLDWAGNETRDFPVEGEVIALSVLPARHGDASTFRQRQVSLGRSSFGILPGILTPCSAADRAADRWACESYCGCMGDGAPPEHGGSRTVGPQPRQRWLARHAVVSGLINGVVSGSILAVVTVAAQWWIDDRREDEAHRRENLRYIREQAANGTLQAAPLRGVDLAGQNLSQLDLKDVTLTAANLSGADLSWAVLSRADLSRANLSEANLDHASLRSAHLSEADFSGATLRGATLLYANLSDVNFREADLTGASLGTAQLRRTDFTDANLTYAHLENIRFYWVKFYGADLTGAQLTMGADARVCYDEHTRWPAGIIPPPSQSPDSCEL